MKNFVGKKGIILGSLLVAPLIIPTSVDAESITNIKWIGENTIEVGNTMNVDLAILNNNGQVVTSGGEFSIDNTSCLNIVEVNKIDASSVSDSKYAFMDLDGKSGDFSLIRLTLKANDDACSATLNLNNGTVKFADSKIGEGLKNLTATHNITVVEKPEEVKEVIETTPEVETTIENVVENVEVAKDEVKNTVNNTKTVNTVKTIETIKEETPVEEVKEVETVTTKENKSNETSTIEVIKESVVKVFVSISNIFKNCFKFLR